MSGVLSQQLNVRELDDIVAADDDRRSALSFISKPAFKENINGTSSRTLFELVHAAFKVDMVVLVAREDELAPESYVSLTTGGSDASEPKIKDR